MKKTVADKWVKALRSGKYKQTTGNLRRADRYCCLGVLCKIMGLRAKKEKYIIMPGIYSYEGETSNLPDSVVKRSGMRSRRGSLILSHDFNPFKTLARLNDTGKSFEEIAAVIEKNWKNL